MTETTTTETDPADVRDPGAATYSPRAALAECLEVWGSGCWDDDNAMHDLEEVMGHVGRLLGVYPMTTTTEES